MNRAIIIGIAVSVIMIGTIIPIYAPLQLSPLQTSPLAYAVGFTTNTELTHNPDLINPDFLNPQFVNPQFVNPQFLNPIVAGKEIVTVVPSNEPVVDIKASLVEHLNDLGYRTVQTTGELADVTEDDINFQGWLDIELLKDTFDR